ncbi:MAG: hypothetical protein OZ921_07615 [Sorangiineae bacterium]|nr:hypothetical protein [Sorangiineae bacterium]
MTPRVPEREARERAFVAVSYLLGRRGAELTEPFASPSLTARALAQALERGEREARVVALAPELARRVSALEARRLT